MGLFALASHYLSAEELEAFAGDGDGLLGGVELDEGHEQAQEGALPLASHIRLNPAKQRCRLQHKRQRGVRVNFKVRQRLRQ